jgi:hypothetical protein
MYTFAGREVTEEHCFLVNLFFICQERIHGFWRTIFLDSNTFEGGTQLRKHRKKALGKEDR